MTEQQRSAFRFRVPRLRPSVPPPRTTTTRTPARKPPVRPPSIPPQGISPSPPPTQVPLPQEPPAPTPQQPEPPAPTPRQPEPPAPTPRQPESPAPTLRQPEPSAPTQLKLEPRAPTPQHPEQPTLTPRQPEKPAPTLQQPEPPAPTQRQPEPPALTQRQPEPPAPTPRQLEPPAPTPQPQELPATTPQESLTSPPTPLAEPSPPQREPPVQPSLPQQDEPASMTTTPIQAAPPLSTFEPHDLTKPTSPSPRLQPSSPQHSYPSQQPKLNMSTDIDPNNNNNQKGTDYPLNAAPNEEQTSTDLSSAHSNTESRIEENQHVNQEAISTTSNIPNTLQTKSVISPPDDKIPESASPESRKLNGEETPPNQNLNEKPPIITLAGDNRGTSMHIGTGKTKREKSIHIYRRYKVNPDESADTMTDDEEKENDSKANENEEYFSYINCNIQGINNSMVFNCSITERSPGVHFGSCDGENVKKPKRKYIKSTDMNRVKVNFTPSHKHKIRRRCLRGFFMESSDSDQNDPQKPRRHGCRYIGEDSTNKDDKMDVV